MAIIRRALKRLSTFQGHCWLLNVYARTVFYLTTRMHSSHRSFRIRTDFARRCAGLLLAGSRRFRSV